MSRARRLTLLLLGAAGVLALGAGAADAVGERSAARTAPPAGRDALVERGRQVFTTETFGGNGRTCATCHRPENDYTIDPAFIARLPASDPLFVAETNPALADLDRPVLLRKLGLISVHADGFDKPAVQRAVPHLLGLRQTTAVEPFTLIPPGGETDLAAALGWSGDGSSGTGSLREFATGAVVQHFTNSMARVPGTDFRLPSPAELRALEAFLLSLGRQDEIDITDATGMRFATPLVERGRRLFNSEVSGSCAFCHSNGGALNDGGFNALFEVGVAARLTAPARKLDPGVPGDGGFGASPRIRVGDRAGYGDGRVNTPSIIEAADTAPFFHDNSAATLEEAVRFYTTTDFANSRDGQALPIIELSGGDVVAIAAMLRTLNAMENIRNSNALLARAKPQPVGPARAVIRLASADTEDAIAVLTGGPRQLFAEAVTLLRDALAVERKALRARSRAARDSLLRQGAKLQEQARSLMIR